MTAEVDANELRDAVERLHGCPAQLVEAVPVSESFEGLIWMAITSALWRRLLAPAAGKRPHDREQPSINPDEDAKHSGRGVEYQRSIAA